MKMGMVMGIGRVMGMGMGKVGMGIEMGVSV